MRVLRILIDAVSGRFSNMLVDYLINSGHVVDVVDSEHSDSWLTAANFNLKVVAKDALDSSCYDFLIDFEGTLGSIDIPRLVFYSPKTQQQDKFLIGIMHDDAYLELSKAYVRCNTGLNINENLRTFFEEVAELFVDAIVSLMRISTSPINYQENTQICNTVFLNYVQLDRALQVLHQFYQEINVKNSIWSAPPLYSGQDVQYQEFSI